MSVFFAFKLAHVNIYEAKSRYVFCSCLNYYYYYYYHYYYYYYYSRIKFFHWEPVTKTIVKVIEDDIYDKLLEIYKGSEKFMLGIL